MNKHRFLVWIALVIVSTSLFACSGVFAARQAKPPVVSLVSAGVGSGTIAGNIFTPREIVVPVGSTITWEIKSDEPHMVTFLPEKATTPDGSPLAWAVTVQPQTVTQFEGATAINSGSYLRAPRLV